MTSPSKGRAVPVTVRKTLIVSDADPDLKKWLWENRARSGEVLRAALRAELLRRGEIAAQPESNPRPAGVDDGVAEHPPLAPTADANHGLPDTAADRSSPDADSSMVESAIVQPMRREGLPLLTDSKLAPTPTPSPATSSAEWLHGLSPDQLSALLALSQQVAHSAPPQQTPPDPVLHDPAIEQLLSMGFG